MEYRQAALFLLGMRLLEESLQQLTGRALNYSLKDKPHQNQKQYWEEQW